MSETGHKSFVRRHYVDGDELLGARWWHEGFEAATGPPSVTRRSALKNLVLLGGGAAVAGLICSKVAGSDDDHAVSMDALELQRREGWDVGKEDGALAFPGAGAVDFDNGTSWQGALGDLSQRLAPAQATLLPFFVPTLLAAPALPAASRLRTALRPVRTDAMEEARFRAFGLLDLFSMIEPFPTDTAIVVDVPGPEAVAVAAALGDRFEPVFLFDNWPHPLGVVPSHLVLGALLYYLPLLARQRAARTTPAPPVFVLDANRLARYVDEDTQFDNRYLARLPSAEAFGRLGVRHLLYVAPKAPLVGSAQELDDLNDDFVAFAKAGLGVKVVTLDDFRRSSVAASGAPVYHWGGSYGSHVWFWHSYSWYSPAPRYAPTRGSFPPVSPGGSGASYVPQSRPTIFSSRTVGGLGGVGRQKPSGFGRISVRASTSTGRITSVGSGRSGSFGRSRSSWSG